MRMAEALVKMTVAWAATGLTSLSCVPVNSIDIPSDVQWVVVAGMSDAQPTRVVSADAARSMSAMDVDDSAWIVGFATEQFLELDVPGYAIDGMIVSLAQEGEPSLPRPIWKRRLGQGLDPSPVLTSRLLRELGDGGCGTVTCRPSDVCNIDQTRGPLFVCLPRPCAEDFRVENHACVPCAADTWRPAGDDPLRADTDCTDLFCGENERVFLQACVPCPDGDFNEAGDDPNGSDTYCEPGCLKNERVYNGACIPCPEGMANEAGDNPFGQDTICETDECYSALGVLCAQFHEAYIKASNADVADYFGAAVSVWGDTMVVGAPYEDSSGEPGDNSSQDSGAVYVFERIAGDWQQTAYLKASNEDSYDRFGTSVSIFGDVLAVGAPGEDGRYSEGFNSSVDNSVQTSGAVYVFRRQDFGWVEDAYLKAPNAGRYHAFGRSVSLSGNTLAVGAPQENSSTTGIDSEPNDSDLAVGAVYVFRSQSSEWLLEAYVKPSIISNSQSFGSSMSLRDDILVVGAPYDRTGDTLGGSAYVFSRHNSNWQQTARLIGSETEIRARDFGRSVARFGDTIAVGAPSSYFLPFDGFPDRVGAVYVFVQDGGAWERTAVLTASNGKDGDYFGYRIALGKDRVFVGAQEEDTLARGINVAQENRDGTSSGAVYAFQKSLGRWQQTAYIKAPNTFNYESFGQVALSGTALIIGARGENSEARGVDGDPFNVFRPRSGAVYVYRLADE